MRPIANRYSARLPVAPAVALAAPDVSLQADADGTLKVIGSGWRPGQQLVITVGADEFSARADSTGDFEVATGPASYQGDVAIHRPFQTSARPGSLVERYMPNPLAVLFAQSVAIGTVLTLFTGGLASLALAARSPPRARLNPMTVGHAIWLDQLTDAERAQLRPGVAESLDRSPDVFIVGGWPGRIGHGGRVPA